MRALFWSNAGLFPAIKLLLHFTGDFFLIRTDMDQGGRGVGDGGDPKGACRIQPPGDTLQTRSLPIQVGL